MQISGTVAAVAMGATILGGAVAGAVIHAATATVRIECPIPAAASNDDPALRRFLAPPAPAATGGARY